MSRTKMIGWSAFGVCLLGYGGAVAAAVLTWVALYGVNPIHFTAPSP
ncbi:hypothetical protein [Brevundimonas sp.]|nr:hypothetical protein [Brevundimonas sp.]MDQ7811632.1 hypothetical protein [Brevundimonas sp.]